MMLRGKSCREDCLYGAGSGPIPGSQIRFLQSTKWLAVGAAVLMREWVESLATLLAETTGGVRTSRVLQRPF